MIICQGTCNSIKWSYIRTASQVVIHPYTIRTPSVQPLMPVKWSYIRTPSVHHPYSLSCLRKWSYIRTPSVHHPYSLSCLSSGHTASGHTSVHHLYTICTASHASQVVIHPYTIAPYSFSNPFVFAECNRVCGPPGHRCW